jgi:hypothetical protein
MTNYFGAVGCSFSMNSSSLPGYKFLFVLRQAQHDKQKAFRLSKAAFVAID